MKLLALVVVFSFSCVKCDGIEISNNYGLVKENIEKYISHNENMEVYNLWNNFEGSQTKSGKGNYSYNGKESGGYTQQNHSGKQRDESYSEEQIKRLDAIFGYTGPTANDEIDNLIRPCALDDWECIRKYFAANSKCIPAYGPIPDPLLIDINTVIFPVVNVTVTFPNFNLRGLSSAKVNDFYFNKKSGNLVFAIDVENLGQTTPRAYLKYQRTGKESIVLADFATFSFRYVTFTAVIPKVPLLRLDLADVHVDVRDSIPAFAFGPGAFNSTDPDVITAFSQFPVLLPFAVREGFFYQSPLFTALYIQKNICDFGLDLISV